MLSDNYFNGDRLSRYLELINEPKVLDVKSLIKEKYPLFSMKVELAISQNRDNVYCNGSFFRVSQKDKDWYERSKNNTSLFFFEEYALDITFSLTEQQYDLITNIQWGLQYLFSSKSYVRRGDFYVFSVEGNDYVVNPRDASKLNYSDNVNVSMVKALHSMGTLSIGETIPFREVADCGQMKIATDLVILAQGMESNANVKVAIIGSASEEYGSGSSYALLDVMFKSSEFHLYDPHESNCEYVTNNKNRYSRRARPYDYIKEDPGYYDIIQDDAYVNERPNRLTIDPKKKLFTAKVVSCKILKSDGSYIKGEKFKSFRQVGKTPSLEKRFYNFRLLRLSNHERRFGDCPFCREVSWYVPNGKYGQEFFSLWFSLHPLKYKCHPKEKFVISGGHYKVGEDEYFIEAHIPMSYCLSNDIIPGSEVSFVMDKELGWYQFSSFSKVPDVLKDGLYAVYDERANVYYTSQKIGTLSFQVSSSYDYEENGIRYLRYNGRYDAFDNFKNFLLCPFIDNSDTSPYFNYYSRIVIRRDSELFISIVKV